jgi:hypothetical protein
LRERQREREREGERGRERGREREREKEGKRRETAPVKVSDTTMNEITLAVFH